MNREYAALLFKAMEVSIISLLVVGAGFFLGAAIVSFM